jgi:hypothetical protein
MEEGKKSKNIGKRVTEYIYNIYMNTIYNDIENSSSPYSNGIYGIDVWRWCFAQPDLGPAPSCSYSQVVARLNTPRPSAMTRILVTRSNRYYDAGCPLDLCDYAAARDLWRILHCV